MRRLRTFFSFAFSVCSSLPAFAACRLSCFAVNYKRTCLVSLMSTVYGREQAAKRAPRGKEIAHFEVEQGFLEAGHVGCVLVRNLLRRDGVVILARVGRVVVWKIGG